MLTVSEVAGVIGVNLGQRATIGVKAIGRTLFRTVRGARRIGSINEIASFTDAATALSTGINVAGNGLAIQANSIAKV